MAKLYGTNFIGPLGNVSVYKRHDIEQEIMRMKGGPSKEQIKKSPKFARTRELNMEFGGRSTTTKGIVHAMWPLKALSDHNITSPLNGLLRPVQLMDKMSDRGKRHVQLTKYPSLLEGFSLNRKRLFDSMIRGAITCTLSREEMLANIEIPSLVPQINFHPQANYPMYRIMATLGVVPDLFYTQGQYEPSSPKYRVTAVPLIMVASPWHPVIEEAEELTLELKYPKMQPDEAYSLVLSIGIACGTMGIGGEIMQVPRAGSAKVLAVV
jgi:hypothetical protein